MGDGALKFNTTGSNNIALAVSAGFNLITGNNNIDIDNIGAAGESGTIRIGNSVNQTRAFFAGISGVSRYARSRSCRSLGRSAWRADLPSKRFKDEIKSMDKTSEAILALKPVTLHL